LSLVAVLGGLFLNATPADAATRGGGVLHVYVGSVSSDAGLANVTVVVQDATNNMQIKGLTDAKGNFKMAVAAGTYTVTALADGYKAERAIVSVKVGETSPLTLRLSQDRAVVASASQPGLIVPKGTLFVHAVSAATGKDVAGAVVSLRDSAGQELNKGTTDSAGAFKAELPHGQYVVVIENAVYKPYKVAVFVGTSQVTRVEAKLELALSTSDPPSTHD
jgi:hypothetical protein